MSLPAPLPITSDRVLMDSAGVIAVFASLPYTAAGQLATTGVGGATIAVVLNGLGFTAAGRLVIIDAAFATTPFAVSAGLMFDSGGRLVIRTGAAIGAVTYLNGTPFDTTQTVMATVI